MVLAIIFSFHDPTWQQPYFSNPWNFLYHGISRRQGVSQCDHVVTMVVFHVWVLKCINSFNFI